MRIAGAGKATTPTATKRKPLTTKTFTRNREGWVTKYTATCKMHTEDYSMENIFPIRLGTVVLDSADKDELAHFYARMLGWHIVY